ncbi:E3 ubiquitin-protein ligase Mdm2-like isoform X2 [Liolophura sinensis]|uniref:E3 ubiquitin-protein ligase Mdm2-like isoform X2 n=1 Tax=Liolophura sinensis TaxID=3198878 RepID=UPI00315901F9
MKLQGWYTCPVMSGEHPEDASRFPRLKTDPRSCVSQKCEDNVVTTTTDTVPNAAVPQLSQSTVVQEYTVNVPLVRPKPEFLRILQIVGAKGEVFTKKEICFYLKEYIGSRLLYDPNDPRIVHCQNDPLGQVFELDSFTINDVFGLLAKHCTAMPDSCIKRRRHVLSPATQHQNRQLLFRAQQGTASESYLSGPATGVALSISVRSQSPISSTTTTTEAVPSSAAPNSSAASSTPNVSRTSATGAERTSRKRSRGKSSSESEGRQSKRRASLTIQNDTESSGYPWYFTVKMETSDDSEVLSVQGKETVRVKDSSDDLWFVEEDQISVHIDTDDTFSVEYEVESDRESDFITELSEGSSDGSEDVLVVCEDSDVEFWADSSASSSSDSDEELSEADKWRCGECDNVNTPVQRFCDRCWKLRPGWLPEFRNQSYFKRSLSAPSGLSSSDSERARKRRRVRQKTSRGVRPSPGASRDVSRPSNSLHSPISSSSSSSSSHNPASVRLSPPQSSSPARPSTAASPKLGNAWTPTKLSRYDSGIGMGPATSSQGSQKSMSSRSPLQSPTKKTTPNCKSKHAKEDGMEVRTTLSNYQSSLSEQFKDLCMICLSKPKNSCIIHGKTSHQVCCYGCAKTLKKRGRSCPVCRRPISHVTKNYLM